ncbi:glycosyltransferase involved in cell wall biosynthesis [Agrobacterium vitis]|nr:glycosyltransferase involved in cell wall biosynthesis [Agrobacterium vitis]MBE1437005.1 glycosyltransferase involved in cell wall biosynthesis [Agrobacterium vitis]
MAKVERSEHARHPPTTLKTSASESPKGVSDRSGQIYTDRRAQPTLSVLAPTRYPWRFNSPRHSRHKIETRSFAPMNYISPKLEGVTVLSPLPLRKFDIVHAFNRIPLGVTPFVMSFESHMPRGFGIEQSALYKFMMGQLLSERCVGIGAISEHARRIFLKSHRDHPQFDQLKRKLFLRYPNMIIEDRADTYSEDAQYPIRVVFVGNHFARKGGCVGVRMAELALEQGIPLEVDIISTVEVGSASWTDPLQPGYFDRYRKLLSLPNVRHLQNIPNAQVLEILRNAHFSLLTTFCDTFGYSVIESEANYVPVIGTAQGALPEFIKHQKNGILLPMDTTDIGEWKHIADDRSTAEFANVHAREVERMAQSALSEIVTIMEDQNRYKAMRQAAYATAKSMFSSKDATAFWDDYYVEAVHKSRNSKSLRAVRQGHQWY